MTAQSSKAANQAGVSSRPDLPVSVELNLHESDIKKAFSLEGLDHASIFSYADHGRGELSVHPSLLTQNTTKQLDTSVLDVLSQPVWGTLVNVGAIIDNQDHSDIVLGALEIPCIRGHDSGVLPKIWRGLGNVHRQGLHWTGLEITLSMAKWSLVGRSLMDGCVDLYVMPSVRWSLDPLVNDPGVISLLRALKEEIAKATTPLVRAVVGNPKIHVWFQDPVWETEACPNGGGDAYVLKGLLCDSPCPPTASELYPDQ